MKNETFANQVARVLNEMVLNGELEAKVRNGETFYRKPLVKTTKVKHKVNKFKNRSLAAKKAWVTRRAMAAKNVSTTVEITVTTSASERAKKAWVTRRLKTTKPAAAAAVKITVSEYSERAKKAWITRRLKCKNNPVKRAERLKLANKFSNNELGVKYKLNHAEKNHKYVSFDQHLERAWKAYEASVEKSLQSR